MAERNYDLEMISIEDIQKMLKMSRSSVYRLLRDWNVRKLRYKNTVRVLKTDFEKAVHKNLYKY